MVSTDRCPRLVANFAGADLECCPGADARCRHCCPALAVLHDRELPTVDLFHTAAVPANARGFDIIPSARQLGAAAPLADDPRGVQAAPGTADRRAVDGGVWPASG